METAKTYADIKDRLAEIAEAVGAEDMALDEALDLYEEALDLGSQVSTAINDLITVSNEQAAAEAAAEVAAEAAAEAAASDAADAIDAADGNAAGVEAASE